MTKMAMGGQVTISGREAEVLAALGEYQTNAEIARRLYISVRTVESHVSSLLRKLGATDRRDLAARANRMGSTSSAHQPDLGMVGLPAVWTTFVGRTSQLEELALALSNHRLVTLVGPGGVGKTRLAMVAAERAMAEFTRAGAFVDLVPVGPEFVVHAAAAVLGVVERPQDTLELVVHERLRACPTLLVLDNCEHVLGPASAFVRSVLAACPETVILATSRERLGVTGERVLPLPPLVVTTLSDDHPEASVLFTDRAGGADLDSTLVTEICRRLEGMPLAIELAAARSSSLGLDGLLAGLSDHLRLLSGSRASDDRHGSLRTVIDWSHQLLDDGERTTFRRLGVFVGAFDLQAVTTVATAGDLVTASDFIGRLADKSLLAVVRDPSGSRWRMLDSVHAYAHEKLRESGEADEIRLRHHRWATTVAGELEASLDVEGWQERFDAVVGDLRAALSVAPTTSGEAAAFDLALALAHLTYARRFLLESRGHYQTAVQRAPDGASAIIALRLAASAALAEMRGEAAFGLLQRALFVAEESDDSRTAAIVLADSAALAGRCPALFVTPLTHRELLALRQRAEALAPDGDLEVAARIALAAAWDATLGSTLPTVAAAQEALDLAKRLGDPILTSGALDAVASAAAHHGQYKKTAQVSAERLQLLEVFPRHDPRVGGEIADIFHMASQSAVAAGHLKSALDSARNSYDDDTNQGLPHFAATHLMVPLVLRGEFDEALLQATVMRQGWERAGSPPAGWMAPAFFAAASVFGIRGDKDRYEEWWELGRLMKLGADDSSCSVFFGCRVALHVGAIEAASRMASQHTQARSSLYHPFAVGIGAEVAVVAGASDAASRLTGAQDLGQENDFVAALLLRAAGRMHHDETLLEESVLGWEAIGARFERACTLALIPSRADEGTAELRALGCGEEPRSGPAPGLPDKSAD
jgi:predicted ATPase/DNA-binding CsgD family transcriptional regulator